MLLALPVSGLDMLIGKGQPWASIPLYMHATGAEPVNEYPKCIPIVVDGKEKIVVLLAHVPVHLMSVSWKWLQSMSVITTVSHHSVWITCTSYSGGKL